MSPAAPDDDQLAAPPHGQAPVPGSSISPAARRPWSPWREPRTDLRAAAVVVAVLALLGLPLGLLWWLLAPRADFRITADGPTAIGNPSAELLAADDVVFALLLAGLGLLAGGLVYTFLRRRRGIALMGAVAVGTAAAGAVAWQLGELLGPAPTRAELTDVGTQVTTGLALHSLPALAVGPFCAVLAYLAATMLSRRDDLGRTHLPPPPELPGEPLEQAPAPDWSRS